MTAFIKEWLDLIMFAGLCVFILLGFPVSFTLAGTALTFALIGMAFGAMFVVMALMFVLGFFLDFIEITFVVVPIVGPVLLKLGLDPV